MSVSSWVNNVEVYCYFLQICEISESCVLYFHLICVLVYCHSILFFFALPRPRRLAFTRGGASAELSRQNKLPFTRGRNSTALPRLNKFFYTWRNLPGTPATEQVFSTRGGAFAELPRQNELATTRGGTSAELPRRNKLSFTRVGTIAELPRQEKFFFYTWRNPHGTSAIDQSCSAQSQK